MAKWTGLHWQTKTAHNQKQTVEIHVTLKMKFGTINYNLLETKNHSEAKSSQKCMKFDHQTISNSIELT